MWKFVFVVSVYLYFRWRLTFLVGFVLLDLQFYVYVLQIVVSPFFFSFGHCVGCPSIYRF
jgi:hypothetical protein